MIGKGPSVTGMRALSFLYQRHQLALVGPAPGDEGVILIPPAASEEGVWVWAGKTRKLRVAGAQAWGT